jgi:hypothetical protein
MARMDIDQQLKVCEQFIWMKLRLAVHAKFETYQGEVKPRFYILGA